MNSLYTQQILGARTGLNVLWTVVLGIGGFGFTVVGLASYPYTPWGTWTGSEVTFVPQGLVMSFYGLAGLMFATYLACAMAWNIGAGYNELDPSRGIIVLFRWGLPGANRRLRLRVLIRDVKAVIVRSQDGWWTRGKVILQLHNGQSCPWGTKLATPSMETLEGEAALLAHVLRVPLQTED